MMIFSLTLHTIFKSKILDEFFLFNFLQLNLKTVKYRRILL